MSSTNKNGRKFLIWTAVLAAFSVGIEEYRKNRQNSIQHDVDASYSDTLDLSEIELTQINVLPDDLEEIQMTEEENENLKMYIANSFGELFKSYEYGKSFDGLLKSDISLCDLYRVKDNPDLCRGFVMKDGKFLKHAKFKEVSPSVLSPVMILQILTIATSQYHMQRITELLNDIHNDINYIKALMEADDYGRLYAANEALQELMTKQHYDTSDKSRALTIADDINKIRGKHMELLSNIKGFNISYKRSGLKESKAKIDNLNQSNYLKTLYIAIRAEMLWIIASLVLIRISRFDGNKEDVDLYQQRIDLNFWSHYRKQYSKARHDVLKYLELEKERSIINKGKIEELKKQLTKRFDDIVICVRNYERLIGSIPVYIKYKDNNIKLYVSYPKDDNIT